MKKIIIFGATGSIGTSTIDIIRNNKDFQLVGISYLSNHQKAKQIVKEFNIKHVIVGNDFKTIDKLLKTTKPDLVVNAVSASDGLVFSYLTIINKIDLVLANKETLVCWGNKIKQLAIKNKVNIYPVDSEHSALYSLIKNKDKTKKIKELIITASGGMFYNTSYKQLNKVEYQDAINNPNWKMGEKISVDSSTLLNKAFEIVEGYWLFETKKIRALVQPQSAIHAMIVYDDNSVDAYIAKCDMKICIKNALYQYSIDDSKNIKHYKNINRINYQLFPIKNQYLKGYDYGKLMLSKINTSLPALINLGNEKAIKLFKDNKLKFLEIYDFIDEFIIKYKNKSFKSINDFIKFKKQII